MKTCLASKLLSCISIGLYAAVVWHASSIYAIDQGTYQIFCKANNEKLVLGGDQNLRQKVSDPGIIADYFTIKRAGDGTTYIQVGKSDNILGEAENGTMLISTLRAPVSDEGTIKVPIATIREQPQPIRRKRKNVSLRLEEQSDGSYRILTLATRRYWHVNGNGDKIVSTRSQSNNNFSKFEFKKYTPPVPRNLGDLRFVYDEEKQNEKEMYRFQTPNFDLELADKTERIFILIHGFKGDRDDLSKLREMLIAKGNRVITVDWSSMSGGDGVLNENLDYTWVLHRSWFVGWRLADEIRDLGLNPANTVLVGSSLGAHIAGSAGYRYNEDHGRKFAQIIGLDAAGQYVGGLGSDVRLDKGDATRVIGIHSSDAKHFISAPENALGWGIEYGDLDIYIYTYVEGSGQLLGSGPGIHRNFHDYSEKVYRLLLEGNSFPFASKWTWNENDFSGLFNFDSLDANAGTVTVRVK